MTRSLIQTIKLLLPLFLAASLSGCATLNRDECMTGDWYHLGTRDGSAGYPMSRLNEHRSACAEFGVYPDEAQYVAGRNAGLAAYCQPANAVRQGLAGNGYSGVCPLPMHYQFAELNRIAYAVHDAHERLESLERRQDGLEHQLHDKKLPDDKRRHLREELRDLDHDIDRARDELRWREFDLDRAYMMPWR